MLRVELDNFLCGGKRARVNKSTKNFIIENVFAWWAGWLSLGLVEVGFRLTLSPRPLILMSIFTLFIYSIIGIILGSICAIIFFLVQRSLRMQQKDSGRTHLSMAFCIFLIIFLYVLPYFLKITLPIYSFPVIFKSGLLLTGSITLFFLLYFFFRWMERKGRKFILYFSILPSLWIGTSLILNMNRKILPPVLQVTTFSRAILLILGSVLCFFLIYLGLSLGRHFINRWGNNPFLKPGLIILPFVLLSLFLFLFLTKGDKKSSRNEIINAPTGKPNIILITLDTVRADHLSCYGYKRLTTPHVDRLSREAVLYKNAYSTDSWTLPSHASIFTGKYPSKHGAHFNPDFLSIDPNLYKTEREKNLPMEEEIPGSIFKLSEENLTLTEILSEKGYRTAGIIGGNFCSSIFGLSQGFDFYNETFFNVSKDVKFFLIYQALSFFFSFEDFFAQYGYIQKRIASQLNNAAFKWLEKNHDQPFFLFINYFDAHRPYIPPPAYNGYFGETDNSILMQDNPRGDISYITAETNLVVSVVKGSHQLIPEEKECVVSRYDGEIRYLDHCLGLLLEKLKALRVYDNTLIIITADHGEAFGEHNQMHHSMTLYEEVLHVPLIIKYPSTSPRKGVVEKRVSLVDLLPTVLSFLNYPIPPEIDGEILENSDHPIIAENYSSLWNYMVWGKRFHRDLRAIYQGKEKYIWSSNSLNELYDLERDSREEENIVGKFPHKAEIMQRTLDQWLASFEPPKTEGEKVKINKSTEEALRALGYVK